MQRSLADTDPEIATAIKNEVRRQAEGLELIASENFVSEAVLQAAGSVMTNKYAEGYPGKRYYGGCEFVDVAESLAITRAKQLFGADHVNVQPHSGAQANMAVFMALLKPGDTFLGMDLSNGGHLTHGSPVNFSGILYRAVSYGVTKDGLLDYEDVRRKAHEHRPKMIIAGYSAYSRVIDFARFAEIAQEVAALFMVDMAHFAGLVAADVYPSQGGPLEHVIAAKAVALKEALEPPFKSYCKQIVANAKTLAGALIDDGFHVVSGGTDNHLMLVDLRNRGEELTGKIAEQALDKAGITVNKNTVPNETRSPFVTSGLRIGTPAVTTRGMKEPEMRRIADLIDRVLRAYDDEKVRHDARTEVRELAGEFPLYPASAIAPH